MREQIPWQQQPFSHNQACLDLIAAKPHGILRILDDQCGFPQVHLRLLNQTLNLQSNCKSLKCIINRADIGYSNTNSP